MSKAERKDHTVPGMTEHAPLPPPTTASGVPPNGAAPAAAPDVAPAVPASASNLRPSVARMGAERAAAELAAPPRVRVRSRSRSRVYVIGATIFLVISLAGYIGLRAYIYGDDAPPIPVLDE